MLSGIECESVVQQQETDLPSLENVDIDMKVVSKV